MSIFAEVCRRENENPQSPRPLRVEEVHWGLVIEGQEQILALTLLERQAHRRRL